MLVLDTCRHSILVFIFKQYSRKRYLHVSNLTRAYIVGSDPIASFDLAVRDILSYRIVSRVRYEKSWRDLARAGWEKEQADQSSGEREREEKRTLERVSPFLPSPGSSPVDQLDLFELQKSRGLILRLDTWPTYTRRHLSISTRDRERGRTPIEAFRNLLLPS